MQCDASSNVVRYSFLPLHIRNALGTGGVRDSLVVLQIISLQLFKVQVIHTFWCASEAWGSGSD